MDGADVYLDCMPRKPRVEYEGAVYHVMCRGDRQESIFRDGADRDRFLETLRECCGRTGWRIHAYVLMGNHYHLLLETPEPNLVAGMRWFQGTYTARYNARHRECGHLFQGRYKALPVDAEDRGYFLQVSTYIHLNPVRARLVDTAQTPLEKYPWSSYPDYLRSVERRSGVVAVSRVLGELGLADDRAGRREYAAYVKGLSAEMLTENGRKDLEKEWKGIRRGWYLGGEEFRDRILEHVDGVLSRGRRKSFSGSEVMAHDEVAAEALVCVGLKALDLAGQNLSALRKLDDRKKVLAWWVRSQTMVGNRWLAMRLEMGDEGNMSKAIRTVARTPSPAIRRTKRLLMKEAQMPKSGD